MHASYLFANEKYSWNIGVEVSEVYVYNDPEVKYYQYEKALWCNEVKQNFRIAFYSHPKFYNWAYEVNKWKKSYSYMKLRLNYWLDILKNNDFKIKCEVFLHRCDFEKIDICNVIVKLLNYNYNENYY